MASITTQTVGAAAAGAVATAINAARVVVAIPKPQREKESIDEADRVTMSHGSGEDSDRSPAEPPRAEAAYAAKKTLAKA